MAIFIFNIFFIYAGITNKLQLNYNWLFLIPVFLLSVSFAITDHVLLRTLNIFLVPAMLLGTFVLITSPPEVKWFKFRFLETVGNKLFEGFEHIWTPYIDSSKNVNLKNTNLAIVKKVFIGLGLGIVLGAIVIGLLASADAFFSKYIVDFFQIFPDTNPRSLIIHFLKIFIASAVFGGIIYSILNLKTKQEDKDIAIKRIFDPISINIALVFLIGIYVFFGVIQFIYLFGVSRDIYDIGMTYSDYAVKGFWELVFVAFINLGIILGALLLTRFKTQIKSLGTKILLGLINLLTFILIYSAHIRLSLYEATYGYSELRIYAHAAIIFLFFLFIFVGFKILRPKISFTKGAVIIWLTIYTILNFINIDGLIANKNIERYEDTGKIDIYYLKRLSADAIPEYTKLLKVNDGELVIRVNKILKAKYEYLKNAIDKEPWHSFNLSRHRALDSLSQFYGEKN